MSGLVRSLESIPNKMKNENTKQSIITAANSYEYIMQKIREIEEKSLKEMQKEKIENIHLDPNEIEPIVLNHRNKGGEER